MDDSFHMLDGFVLSTSMKYQVRKNNKYEVSWPLFSKNSSEMRLWNLYQLLTALLRNTMITMAKLILLTKRSRNIDKYKLADCKKNEFSS